MILSSFTILAFTIIKFVACGVTMADIQKIFPNAAPGGPLVAAPPLLESFKLYLLSELERLKPSTETDAVIDAKIGAPFDPAKGNAVTAAFAVLGNELKKTENMAAYVYCVLMKPAFDEYKRVKLLSVAEANDLATGMDAYGFQPKLFKKIDDLFAAYDTAVGATNGFSNPESTTAKEYRDSKLSKMINVSKRIRYMLDAANFRIISPYFVNFKILIHSRLSTYNGTIVTAIADVGTNWSDALTAVEANVADQTSRRLEMKNALLTSIHQITLDMNIANLAPASPEHTHLNGYKNLDTAFVTANENIETRFAALGGPGQPLAAKKLIVKEKIAEIVNEINVLSTAHSWNQRSKFSALSISEIPIRTMFYHFHLICPAIRRGAFDLKTLAPTYGVFENADLRAFANQFYDVLKTLDRNRRGAQFVIEFLRAISKDQLPWGSTNPSDAQFDTLIDDIEADIGQTVQKATAIQNVTNMMNEVKAANNAKFYQIFLKKAYFLLRDLDFIAELSNFFGANDIASANLATKQKLQTLAAVFMAFSEFSILKSRLNPIADPGNCAGARAVIDAQHVARDAFIAAAAEKEIYEEVVTNILLFTVEDVAKFASTRDYSENDLIEFIVAKYYAAILDRDDKLEILRGLCVGSAPFSGHANDNERLACIRYELQSDVLVKVKADLLSNIVGFKPPNVTPVNNDEVRIQLQRPSSSSSRKRTKTEKSSKKSSREGSGSKSTGSSSSKTDKKPPKNNSEGSSSSKFESIVHTFVISFVIALALV